MRHIGILGLFVAALVVSCGARTNIEVYEEDDSGSRSVAAYPVDSGKDSSARDSGPDVIVTDAGCTTDRDCNDGFPCTEDRCDPRLHLCTRAPHDEVCDDGLFCNGAEICVLGRGCTPGVRSCADSVACTNDSCDESARACVHTPDDSKCPISHVCDPSSGCEARAIAHDSDTLYDIRLPSGQVNVIGRLGATLLDCALHPSNVLYGVDELGVWNVDQTTAATTKVLTAGLAGSTNAADVSPEGDLYVAAGSTVYRVDFSTRATVPTYTFPPGTFSSGDLAFIGNRLFASAGDGGTDSLVEIDRATNTSRVVGDIGSDCVWGLAAFGSTLYGLTCEGRILTIDLATGRGHIVQQTNIGFWGASAR